MKRITVFLFCLIILSSIVYADAATLTLTTRVEGENLIKLSKQPLRLGNVWNSADKNLTLNFESPAAQEAYVNLRTNSYTTYYINLQGIPLAAEGTTTKIGYTIAPIAGDNYLIGGSLIVDASHINDSVDHFVTFPRRHGMRVVPAKFSVELNEIDWDNASEGGYSGTVTFSLSTT